MMNDLIHTLPPLRSLAEHALKIEIMLSFSENVKIFQTGDDMLGCAQINASNLAHTYKFIWAVFAKKKKN